MVKDSDTDILIIMQRSFFKKLSLVGALSSILSDLGRTIKISSSRLLQQESNCVVITPESLENFVRSSFLSCLYQYTVLQVTFTSTQTKI